MGAVAIAFSLWIAATLRATHSLHMFQMDSYIPSRYGKWLWAKPWRRALDAASIGAAGVIYALSLLHPAALLGWPLHCLLLWLRRDRAPAKKPLEMTGRARRILWTARLLLALSSVGLWAALDPVAASLAVMHLAPAAILAANALLKPVQARINRGFVRAAAAKIRGWNPVVVGIAGSYGKTSTKYFIDTLLSERYRTLKTPGNVNTLLGVTRVINETLDAAHEVFVVEMGAYKRGEVREIAELVSPRIGVITSIGPEHWERFRTMDNVERTNYELIESLPAGGLAVFNGDNEHCRDLAGRTSHTRVVRYSLSSGDLWAEGIEHSADGARFTVAGPGGLRIPAATPLVGRLNVLNILGAVAVALELGLSPEEVGRGIGKLKPAPNRLEVKRGLGGTVILDDSYNSNPMGAAEALHVLSQFTTGRRVLVTPGMIELGELHREKNEELGLQAARACDYVFLVGPEQTRPIADGLRKGGFAGERLYVVKSLSEATAIFGKLLRPGDVILFENDLPDLYTEP